MSSFIQPCFIRKNTSELRKKLEDIGHVRYPYEFADWDDDGKDRKYIIIDIMYYTYSTEPIGKPKKKDVDFVDCGDNEELFLALAALRDDTDKNQWIIDEASEGFGFEDSWMICDKDNMNDRCVYTHYRKASVKEIIERFKN